MPNLVTDSTGKPSPQYLSEDGTRYEYQQGKDGALNVNIKGLNIKAVTSNTSEKAIPTQIIDSTGKVIDKFINDKSKKNILLFDLNSRVGESVSEIIPTSDYSDISIVVYKTVGDSAISSIVIEGNYNNTYIPICNIENLNEQLNSTSIINLGLNSYENQIILPSQIKIKVNTSVATTYLVHVTLL